MTILASMRSRDGRSLARALAALMFLNALFGGLHAGLAAAAADGLTIICAVGSSPDGGSDEGQLAVHEHACCLPSAAPAPLLTPPQLPAVWPVTIDKVPGPFPPVPPVRLVLVHEGPRGPPVLA